MGSFLHSLTPHLLQEANEVPMGTREVPAGEHIRPAGLERLLMSRGVQVMHRDLEGRESLTPFSSPRVNCQV